MPTPTDIVISDGESTPVAHTFEPELRDGNGVFHFAEKDGVPIGDNKFTVLLKSPQNRGDLYRGKLVLSLPTVVTETINGVDSPKIARTAYVEVGFRFSDESTTQERKNAIRLMSDALAGTSSLLDDVVVDLKGLY